MSSRKAVKKTKAKASKPTKAKPTKAKVVKASQASSAKTQGTQGSDSRVFMQGTPFASPFYNLNSGSGYSFASSILPTPSISTSSKKLAVLDLNQDISNSYAKELDKFIYQTDDFSSVLYGGANKLYKDAVYNSDLGKVQASSKYDLTKLYQDLTARESSFSCPSSSSSSSQNWIYQNTITRGITGLVYLPKVGTKSFSANKLVTIEDFYNRPSYFLKLKGLVDTINTHSINIFNLENGDLYSNWDLTLNFVLDIQGSLIRPLTYKLKDVFYVDQETFSKTIVKNRLLEPNPLNAAYKDSKFSSKTPLGVYREIDSQLYNKLLALSKLSPEQANQEEENLLKQENVNLRSFSIYNYITKPSTSLKFTPEQGIIYQLYTLSSFNAVKEENNRSNSIKINLGKVNLEKFKLNTRQKLTFQETLDLDIELSLRKDEVVSILLKYILYITLRGCLEDNSYSTDLKDHFTFDYFVEHIIGANVLERFEAINQYRKNLLDGRFNQEKLQPPKHIEEHDALVNNLERLYQVVLNHLQNIAYTLIRKTPIFVQNLLVEGSYNKEAIADYQEYLIYNNIYQVDKNKSVGYRHYLDRFFEATQIKGVAYKFLLESNMSYLLDLLDYYQLSNRNIYHFNVDETTSAQLSGLNSPDNLRTIANTLALYLSENQVKALRKATSIEDSKLIMEGAREQADETYCHQVGDILKDEIFRIKSLLVVASQILSLPEGSEQRLALEAELKQVSEPENLDNIDNNDQVLKELVEKVCPKIDCIVDSTNLKSKSTNLSKVTSMIGKDGGFSIGFKPFLVRTPSNGTTSGALLYMGFVEGSEHDSQHLPQAIYLTSKNFSTSEKVSRRYVVDRAYFSVTNLLYMINAKTTGVFMLKGSSIKYKLLAEQARKLYRSLSPEQLKQLEDNKILHLDVSYSGEENSSGDQEKTTFLDNLDEEDLETLGIKSVRGNLSKDSKQELTVKSTTELNSELNPSYQRVYFHNDMIITEQLMMVGDLIGNFNRLVTDNTRRTRKDKRLDPEQALEAKFSSAEIDQALQEINKQAYLQVDCKDYTENFTNRCLEDFCPQFKDQYIFDPENKFYQEREAQYNNSEIYSQYPTPQKVPFAKSLTTLCKFVVCINLATQAEKEQDLRRHVAHINKLLDQDRIEREQEYKACLQNSNKAQQHLEKLQEEFSSQLKGFLKATFKSCYDLSTDLNKTKVIAKFSEEKLREVVRLSGTSCIVTNHIETTATEISDAYDGRFTIEQSIQQLKSDYFQAVYCSKDEFFNVKSLLAILGLFADENLVNFLKQRFNTDSEHYVRDILKNNNLTLQRIKFLLSSIEVNLHANGLVEFSEALTNDQKFVLALLNITAGELLKSVAHSAGVLKRNRLKDRDCKEILSRPTFDECRYNSFGMTYKQYQEELDKIGNSVQHHRRNLQLKDKLKY